jgi:hypothetical protein
MDSIHWIVKKHLLSSNMGSMTADSSDKKGKAIADIVIGKSLRRFFM